MKIRQDDLRGEEIANFLREHLANMREVSPPESIHALDLAALRAPEFTSWSIWEGDELVGAGALKELNTKSGEVKSMRTAVAHRSRGIGSRMLEHIIDEAKRRGYDHLYLETGSQPAFAPAQALYLRYGFEYREPFGDYTNDSNSVFMTKRL